MLGFALNSDKAPSEAGAGDAGGGGAAEGVQNQLAGAGGGFYNAGQQSLGLLGGVLAVALFGLAGGHDGPQGLHLLAAVLLFHQLIVERVAAFGVLGGPQNCLGGVGEVAAGEVRRGVDLEPGDVVEYLVVQRLQGVADAVDVVRRAGDPERAVRAQQAAALVEPEDVEVVVGGDALRLVPAAFVHAHHAAIDAGDAAVGEEVRRVGKNHVHGLGRHPAQEVQRVGLIEPQTVIGRGIKRRRRVVIARPCFVNAVGGKIGDGSQQGQGAGRRIGGGAVKQSVKEDRRRGIGQGGRHRQNPLRTLPRSGPKEAQGKAIRSYPIRCGKINHRANSYRLFYISI